MKITKVNRKGNSCNFCNMREKNARKVFRITGANMVVRMCHGCIVELLNKCIEVKE